VDDQALDAELRESLVQLLEVAEQWEKNGRQQDAEAAYREAILTAEQQHLPDLLVRSQRGVKRLLGGQRLAQAESALASGETTDAVAGFREVLDQFDPESAIAVSRLAQAYFLLGQQAEADERPLEARQHYTDALRFAPQHAQAAARLAALASPRRRLLGAKIGWILIPVALVLGALVVRALQSQPATVPGIAAATLPPTAAPIASPASTATRIISPTAVPATALVRATSGTSPETTPAATPAPSATPSRLPSVTPTVPRTVALTFRGRIQQPDGSPLGGFQYVQLWGGNGPDRGEVLIHKTPTDVDGSFVLYTTTVYDYYFITLDTDFPKFYEYVSVTPGPEGIWRGPREIRYQNPAGGVHDAILFLVRTTPAPAVSAPAPTSTMVVTPPVLPAITLLEPPADFSTRDSAQFRWAADRSLPDGVFYEVVMWAEGQNPRDALGVVRVTRDKQTSVSFGAVAHVPGGVYYWTVILVRTAPDYQRLSQPVAGRRIYVEKDRNQGDNSGRGP
jgi:hypothetical protein